MTNTADKPDGYLLDPSTIQRRRWKCCGVVHPIGTRPNAEGELKTVIVACDRKAGHNGLHRGRFDGRKYMFETLGAAERRSLDGLALAMAADAARAKRGEPT